VGVVSPAIRLSRVDLPQPEWPISATNSPLATVRLTFCSAERPFGLEGLLDAPNLDVLVTGVAHDFTSSM
jgi:hypothetical protein